MTFPGAGVSTLNSKKIAWRPFLPELLLDLFLFLLRFLLTFSEVDGIFPPFRPISRDFPHTFPYLVYWSADDDQ